VEETTKDVIITPPPAVASASVDNPTVWISDNFAQDWFADALHEARTGKDYHAIRREIILATCFLESYIFEWTRLKVQIEELNDYFPSSRRFNNDTRYRRTLKAKWKDIPRELFEAGKLLADPSWHLSGLGTLLKYRHGLVHAAASRPATDSQPQDTKPFPTKNMLKKLKHGWAVRVVVDLVKDLHHAVGDSVPNYIEYP
jgi:hypothetical protein